MARIRANDYDLKVSNILNVAAALFAEFGYAGSKMEQIAERCEVSKSMLYHYFKKKEDVLFAILQEHVKRLIVLAEAHIKKGDYTNIDEFFRGFIGVYLEPSKDARARHVVAMVDMRYLNDKQKLEQIKIEKELVRLVSNALEKLGGTETPAERKMYGMLLIGMLNWTELWYTRNGKISPSEFYDRISQLFMYGFLKPYVKGSTVTGVEEKDSSLSVRSD